MEKIPKDRVSYKYTFKVTKEDIDDLGHVNNIVYLKWVLKVSELHWNSLVTMDLRKTSVWVVLKHEIDYIDQSYLDDIITIYTWIEKTSGVRSVRYVHIYCNDKIITKCKSTWCLLNVETLKPKRISNEILKLFTKN